jgi:hypothetical protein
MKIHESGYGEGPLNFHIRKFGSELSATLTYPPWTDADNKTDQCRYVCVNQESVRASDGVRLHYDYQRDGFVIEQPRRRIKKTGPDTYEEVEDWVEVAFCQSWHFEEDEDKMYLNAEAEWEAEKQKVLSGSTQAPE